jgi:hypothetical protein
MVRTVTIEYTKHMETTLFVLLILRTAVAGVLPFRPIMKKGVQQNNEEVCDKFDEKLPP